MYEGPKIARPKGNWPFVASGRDESAEGSPSDGVPGVPSKRPSVRRPKGRPVDRPQDTRWSWPDTPYGRTPLNDLTLLGISAASWRGRTKWQRELSIPSPPPASGASRKPARGDGNPEWRSDNKPLRVAESERQRAHGRTPYTALILGRCCVTAESHSGRSKRWGLRKREGDKKAAL